MFFFRTVNWLNCNRHIPTSADLQSTYSGQYEDYINRLSAYMTSSGKHYANHYATIRKWLDEDSKPKPSKNYDYTETYEEGECL